MLLTTLRSWSVDFFEKIRNRNGFSSSTFKDEKGFHVRFSLRKIAGSPLEKAALSLDWGFLVADFEAWYIRTRSDSFFRSHTGFHFQKKMLTIARKRFFRLACEMFSEAILMPLTQFSRGPSVRDAGAS